MTNEHLEEIRARHHTADVGPNAWEGVENPERAVEAFEDRAELLDEVDRLRGRDARLLKVMHTFRKAMSGGDAINTGPEFIALCDAWDEAIVETRVRT
jgi:hypothetical protein